MATVGVLYLLFEKSILPTKMRDGKSAFALDGMSKVLAMVVTRSSVASLAARKGLPLGNQVTGWIVLSELLIAT